MEVNKLLVVFVIFLLGNSNCFQHNDDSDLTAFALDQSGIYSMLCHSSNTHVWLYE